MTHFPPAAPHRARPGTGERRAAAPGPAPRGRKEGEGGRGGAVPAAETCGAAVSPAPTAPRGTGTQRGAAPGAPVTPSAAVRRPGDGRCAVGWHCHHARGCFLRGDTRTQRGCGGEGGGDGTKGTLRCPPRWGRPGTTRGRWDAQGSVARMPPEPPGTSPRTPATRPPLSPTAPGAAPRHGPGPPRAEAVTCPRAQVPGERCRDARVPPRPHPRPSPRDAVSPWGRSRPLPAPGGAAGPRVAVPRWPRCRAVPCGGATCGSAALRTAIF